MHEKEGNNRGNPKKMGYQDMPLGGLITEAGSSVKYKAGEGYYRLVKKGRGQVMRYGNHKKISIIALFIIFSMAITTRLCAQEPPGFDFRVEWEHFEEQSKDRREVDVTQIGARVGYSLPQTLALYLALGWQDIDARLPDPNSAHAHSYDLDPALAFRIGAKVYVLRSIPMGVPADFSISLSYSTAKHKENKTKLKFTHRRVIGTGDLEWHYVHAIPYLSLGLLYSEMGAPLEDYDQTSLLFAGGVYFPISENVFIRTELNWCQEVGYILGLQYRF